MPSPARHGNALNAAGVGVDRHRAMTAVLPRSRADRKPVFRAELQGLRALAVVLVVLYHVWLGRVSGGVDVFFLLSGFLLTGQLTRALARGDIDCVAVWGRMIRRLMPAMLTVLAACVIAGVILLPENRWLQTIREITAAAIFAENWQLAADSTDYFAQHDGASLVQHFWSLSVQGQFYLVWPVLIGVLGWVGYKLGPNRTGRAEASRALVGAALALLFTSSLAFSIWLTAVNQQLAYFHSFARVWEFALGGLLALVIGKLVLPVAARVALGWAGVLGLLGCGLVLQVGQMFPGYAALWPTLCAAAVLVAGRTGRASGVDRLLAAAPLQYLGNLSFSLYLWHWPVLVLFLVQSDRAEPGIAGGCAVIALSVALAALTHRFVETPVVASPAGARPGRDHLVAAVGVLGLLAAVGCWQLVSAHKARAYALAIGDLDHPGALVLTPGFEYWGADDPPLAPSLVSLGHDRVSLAALDCAMSPRGSGLEVCRSQTVGPPARRVALVGDSHPAQFLTALRPIAAERNWQLLFMSRGGCAFSAESDIRPGDQSCVDWNAAALDELLAQRPDFVFTAATREVRTGLGEYTPTGYVEQWRKLAAENIAVLAARDNPRFDTAPSRCVESKGRDAAECMTPRSALYSGRAPYADLPDVPATVRFLDFSDSYCDADVCPAVIGNVLVYMDDNHVSATYLTTMRPIVERALDDALTDLQLGHPAS